jgi:flagellar protein FlaG
MRIRSSVTPTPIVSMTTGQPEAADVHAGTASAQAPRVETEPMTVDLGSKLIELQPGEIAKVVDKLNQTARVFNHTLQFQMGESKNIVIRVIDTVSGQVVREIPPDDLMDAFTRMEDALGLLLDRKA